MAGTASHMPGRMLRCRIIVRRVLGNVQDMRRPGDGDSVARSPGRAGRQGNVGLIAAS